MYVANMYIYIYVCMCMWVVVRIWHMKTSDVDVEETEEHGVRSEDDEKETEMVSFQGADLSELPAIGSYGSVQ